MGDALVVHVGKLGRGGIKKDLRTLSLQLSKDYCK